MTLEELQNLASEIQVLIINLDGANSNLREFSSKVNQIVNDPIFSSTIDVDDFIAVQSPIYLNLLNQVGIYAAALGIHIPK